MENRLFSIGVDRRPIAQLHDIDFDPIELPRDLSNLIYTYTPNSAISLDPKRRAEIIRLLTRCQVDISDDSDTTQILQNLTDANWDHLVKYPELYPYIRNAIQDRAIWITLLFRHPTVASLTELLEIDAITHEEIQRFSWATHGTIIHCFVSNACDRGNLPIIEELDRLRLRMHPGGADIWQAFRDNLVQTKAPDLAMEMAKRIPDPLDIISSLPRLCKVPQIILEWIRIHPDYLNEMMDAAVTFHKLPIALHLYHTHQVRIPRFVQNSSSEFTMAAIESGCLSVKWSNNWRIALENIDYLGDEKQIETILVGCGVSKSWPFDGIDGGSPEEQTKRLCPGVTHEMIQTLVYNMIVTLLNRLPPDMITNALLNQHDHGFRKDDTLEKVDSNSDLKAATCVAIMRGFQEEKNFPWLSSGLIQN